MIKGRASGDGSDFYSTPMLSEEKSIKSHYRSTFSTDDFDPGTLNMSPPSAIEVTAVTDMQGTTIPPPVSANELFAARRSKAGRMVAGTAAVVDVLAYKGSGHGHKPLAKRWDGKHSRSLALVMRSIY